MRLPQTPGAAPPASPELLSELDPTATGPAPLPGEFAGKFCPKFKVSVEIQALMSCVRAQDRRGVFLTQFFCKSSSCARWILEFLTVGTGKEEIQQGNEGLCLSLPLLGPQGEGRSDFCHTINSTFCGQCQILGGKSTTKTGAGKLCPGEFISD